MTKGVLLVPIDPASIRSRLQETLSHCPGSTLSRALRQSGSRFPLPPLPPYLFDQDEEALREFDELMQSSSTMKVSLTPDRLKSMEVRPFSLTRFSNY